MTLCNFIPPLVTFCLNCTLDSTNPAHFRNSTSQALPGLFTTPLSPNGPTDCRPVWPGSFPSCLDAAGPSSLVRTAGEPGKCGRSRPPGPRQRCAIATITSSRQITNFGMLCLQYECFGNRERNKYENSYVVTFKDAVVMC